MDEDAQTPETAAKRVQAALELHSPTFMQMFPNDRDCAAADLITDVLHWCQVHNMDTERVLRLARENYEYEQENAHG